MAETSEHFYHGIWEHDFFFFVDMHNKFKVFINNKQFTLANFNDSKVICEYLKNHEKFFFFDNQCQITTFHFSKNLFKIFSQHLLNLEQCDFDKLE